MKRLPWFVDHDMGHLTEVVGKTGEGRQMFVYLDTQEPVPLQKEKRRECALCKKARTVEGHDPCISNLPGVKFACCGHGVQKGYVSFENGVVLRGEFDQISG